jgi:hypothetical protein
MQSFVVHHESRIPTWGNVALFARPSPVINPRIASDGVVGIGAAMSCEGIWSAIGGLLVILRAH